MASLQLYKGDITDLSVDAIVNAANNSLLGGGGVDGAIHRGAGPELYAYNKGLGGCDTGDAKISPGFKLKARYVISTVGPIWQGGNHHEAELLESCYVQSLNRAVENHCRTVAFPSISTGVYGYPVHLAAPIAVKAIKSFLETHAELDVILVCFSDEVLQVYKELGLQEVRFE